MITQINRILRLAFLPAACAGLLAACAPYDPYYGANPGPVQSASVASGFDRYDTNRDGFLSRAEVEPLGVSAAAAAPMQNPADTFRSLDTNADGFLSRAEAGVTFNAIPGGSFDAFDANRDGFLAMTEATPHLQWLQRRTASSTPSFDALDANRDGFLSRTEAGPLFSSAQVSGPVVAPVVFTFDRLDADRDGFLSRGEAAAVANPLTFDRYDRNHDGFLSRAEGDLMLRATVGTSR